MVQYVETVNELTKGKLDSEIDLGDLIVTIICSAIMILSYVPNPASRKIFER